MNSPSAQLVLARLRSLQQSLTGAEQRVATLILNHSPEVVSSTLQEVARASEVGVGTVMRVCTKLGYAGFAEMKVALAAELRSSLHGAPDLITSEDALATVFDKVFRFGLENLNDTSLALDAQRMEWAAQRILRAQRVEIYAGGTMTGAMAHMMQHRLLLLAIPSAVYTAPDQQLLAAGFMSGKDTAIGISHTGETEAVISALGVARSAGAFTIGITNASQSALTKVSEVTLLAASRDTGLDAPEALSHIGMMAIVDSLYAGIQVLQRKTRDGKWIPNVLTTHAAGAQDQLSLLRIGVPNLPLTMDPHHKFSNRNTQIYPFVFDTLLQTGRTNQSLIEPALARKWHRRDSRTLELWLREDVTWHDGTPFTATDVGYTFDRILSRNTELDAASLSIWPDTDIQIVDKYRLQFTSHEPDPFLELRLTNFTTACIIPAHYHSTVSTDTFAYEKPIGTGPFQLEAWQPSSHMSFINNKHFYAPLPSINQVTVREITVPDRRIEALLTGEVDLITDVFPDRLNAFDNHSEIALKSSLLSRMYLLFYNMFAPPMDRVEIRQALALAIDRNRIIEKCWRGYAVHPRGFQFPGELFFEGDRPFTAYDPDYARDLLQRGNYQGEPILFVIASPDYYVLNRVYAEEIISMWHSIGINARLVTMSQSRIHELYFQQESHHHVYDSSISTFGSPEDYLIGFWGNADDALHKTQKWDSLSSQPYLSLVQQFQRRMIDVERKDFYRQLRDELERTAPGTPLFIPERIYAMRSNLTYLPTDYLGLGLRHFRNAPDNPSSPLLRNQT
jgi:peptide/nickel transport system substrate-binding protein